MHGRGSSMYGRDQIIYGCVFLFVRYNNYLEAIIFMLKSHVGSSSFVRCPESRSVDPLLGGCFSISNMLISIRNTELVRCREVVRFSEGPLSEARLYNLKY